MRIKKIIKGNDERPRLVVYKGTKNFYAQIINDITHLVLVSSSTLKLKLKRKNMESIKKVAEDILKLAKEKKIKKIVFDRGKWPYHGKIKAFAESLREGGLEF